jgi:hypothetical protein
MAKSAKPKKVLPKLIIIWLLIIFFTASLSTAYVFVFQKFLQPEFPQTAIGLTVDEADNLAFKNNVFCNSLAYKKIGKVYCDDYYLVVKNGKITEVVMYKDIAREYIGLTESEVRKKAKKEGYNVRLTGGFMTDDLSYNRINVRMVGGRVVEAGIY